jgi:phosphoesterase RecJ-like protein
MAEVLAELEGALDRAADAIVAAPSVVLACHVDPDGDALGSMLALHHLCRSQGKPSIATWPEPFVVAPHYTFLPGLEGCTKPEDAPADPGLMVTFDCGSLGRLRELAAAAAVAAQRRGLIVVDHHRSNDRYGSINVIDPDAAASAVVVRRLAQRLGWPLTRDAALCLYTGVVTDTGRFQYDNTTADVFALAHELSSFDLPIAPLTRQLFEEHRFAYLQLAAHCLTRAELDRDLGFVATWVTDADLERFGVALEETEGLIDMIRQAAEAEVSCVLKETERGVRVSLRAISWVDVGAIAVAFGGGGHRFAAGFTLDGTVGDVLAAVHQAVANAMHRGRPSDA